MAADKVVSILVGQTLNGGSSFSCQIFNTLWRFVLCDLVEMRDLLTFLAVACIVKTNFTMYNL